jgi:hypothetical protein
VVERIDWRPGDAVLFGVRVERGDGPELLGLRFTLRAAPADASHGDAEDPADSAPIELTALVREGGAQRALEASGGGDPVAEPSPAELTMWVPHRSLMVSIPDGVRAVAAARADRAAGRPPPPDLGERLRRVGIAVYTFFDIGRQKPELWRLITDVSDRPSWFSVLTHLGVEVTLRMDLEASQPLERVPGLPLPVPGCRVPIVVLANGDPALYVNVYAIEPLPPYHLVGGVVAIEAYRPSDPRITLRLDLIAARRGAPTTDG